MAADVGAAQRQAESCSLFDTDAALREATRYHSGGKSGSFPYITWNWRQNGEERMQQKAVPVSRLALLIGQIPTRPRWREEHHYIVQHEFRRPDRRAIHLWAMGLLWADVDLRHEEGSSACSAAEIDGYVGRLLLDCSDNNIPEPSLVVWTGRGLQAKWLFDKPLPSQALPRWSAAMRGLSSKLANVGWTMDPRAMDVSRILRIVGTYNPAPGSSGFVRIVQEGPAYEFDHLCDWFLPYTRSQVERFRADAQARREAMKEWQHFDTNRRRAQEMMGRTVRHAVQAAQEAEQSLHWWRLEVIRQAAAARGGIAPGQRNEWVWVASNSLAWGLGEAGKLWCELPQIVREIAPSMTWPEAQNSASSVYARLKQGGRDALYRMKNETIIQRLGLTDAEARALRGSGHGTKNPGAMQLPGLRDLDFDQWRQKVQERFQAGAQYTNTHRAADAPARAQAASVQSRLKAREKLRDAVRRLRMAGTPTGGILNSLPPDVHLSRRTIERWCADLPRAPRDGYRP